MPSSDDARSRRPAWHVVAALLLGMIVVACGCLPPSGQSPALSPPTTTKLRPLDLKRAQDQSGAAPLRSIVAHATGKRVDVYVKPGASSVQRRLSNPIPDGGPLIFLVAEQRQRWLKVFLPVRPNGSTGWVRARQVRLFEHHFHIVVALKAHMITVYRRATVILREPVGVGKQQTPTPGGLYYTTELIRLPNPNGIYGSYAYALSGFSEVLRTFNGGEAFLGIHGTNDPSALGRDVSHGCIRMSNAGITKLAKLLPLGVPVLVIP
jgi:lipoprotein-anchoring transpeptidase ErfK/SrfK